MSHDPQRTRFVHQRLDAYRVSLELFREIEQLSDGFPRGHAELKDQLRKRLGEIRERYLKEAPPPAFQISSLAIQVKT